MKIIITKGLLLCMVFIYTLGVVPNEVRGAGENTVDTIFYVCPNGNDSNIGTLEAPFKSILKAQNVARKTMGIKKIYLRSGTYFQLSTLIFTSADSNTSYLAYPGEKPIISGAKEISKNWIKEGKLFYNDLGKNYGYYFKNLYVGEEKRQRARYPNISSTEPNKVLYRNGLVKGRGSDAIKFKNKDISFFSNWQDVNVNLYMLWCNAQLWVKSVDSKNKICYFDKNMFYSQEKYPFWNDPNGRYYLENAKEFIDIPGEWYLNRKTGRLYYYPMKSENAQNLVVKAPQMSRLVYIQGSKSQPVINLNFSGINFMHTDWNDKDHGKMVGQQACESLGQAVIYAEYAKKCLIDQCEISLGGAHGIFFSKGSSDNVVVQTHIYKMGGGGVYIGEPGWKASYIPPKGDEIERNTVNNCLIHNLSEFFHGSVGVWVGCSSYNQISHNDIFNNDYTGISVGFSWLKDPIPTSHDNLIEKNHVHHIGQGELSDGGGIYLLGNAPNTVVKNNVVDHYKTFTTQGFGIYVDNGSTGVTVEQNLVFKTDSASLFVKGDKNIIRNNIFAYAGTNMLLGMQESTELDDDNYTIDWGCTFENNIVLNSNKFDIFGERFWNSKAVETNKNLYWDIYREKMVTFFKNGTLVKWQASNHDKNSIVKSPEFQTDIPISPEEFKLKTESPAFTLGFVEPEIDEVGLYGSTEWVNLKNSYPILYKNIYEELQPKTDK